MASSSPFLDPGPLTTPNTLAIAHLSRDNLQPVLLQDPSSTGTDGYAEGHVLNTRFGSFPHSTLVGVPWGSQIRASTVDTGSRGRKRKRAVADEVAKDSTPGADDTETTTDTPQLNNGAPPKKAVAAPSGFIHILAPTPELWTQSLPHRTQVVYTPDYSYILQRIRARPGMRVIEAGAGSGSFTHASARAVYSGYPSSDADSRGRVFSFEFHETRFEKLTAEIKLHGLDDIVKITHRDVCEDGFLVDGASPQATSVFLDLPAPWEALPHLSRQEPQAGKSKRMDLDRPWISPLDPSQSIYICTFSPCIEQVTRTIDTLRSLGWIEIDMVEIAHKNLGVYNERIGEISEKGAVQVPGDVAQAVARLKTIEKKTRAYHASQARISQAKPPTPRGKAATDSAENGTDPEDSSSDGDSAGATAKWQVTHRAEAEIKTHTSYLVFAILPREWSEEDEAAALARWPCGNEQKVVGVLDRDTRRREKAELAQGKKKQKRQEPSSTQENQSHIA